MHYLHTNILTVFLFYYCRLKFCLHIKYLWLLLPCIKSSYFKLIPRSRKKCSNDNSMISNLTCLLIFTYDSQNNCTSAVVDFLWKAPHLKEVSNFIKLLLSLLTIPKISRISLKISYKI